jgi:predicted O-methyltransferase YrrM
MKSTIKKMLGRFGYELTRPIMFDGSLDPHSHLLDGKNIVDLDRLAQISLSIPGMVTPRSGQILYALCAFQEATGDVVEIGSWQGRSTSFLARAVSDSGNGRFFAIDHFKGNVGKETSYVVGKHDLSDLKQNFLANMKTLSLDSSVNLLDMPTIEAAKEFRRGQVRFAFIDGDHTYEGVSRDIELIIPLLCPRAIMVFDDFSTAFPGLLKAVDEMLKSIKHSRCLSYQNTLVVRL